jgi:superfamily II DNA/RNA helicase
MPFSIFGFSKEIKKVLEENSFTEPMAVQKKVIPLVFKKHDIIVKAQTGTGKSASFILPILEMLSQSRGEGKAKIKVLVLTPTRELTLQISQIFETFAKYLEKRPKVVSLIGGESIGNQLYSIQQGCDILVATSGRFLDVLNKNKMN